jgi:hypothetical protein
MATTVTTGSTAIANVLQCANRVDSNKNVIGCNWTDLVALFQAVILFGIYLASVVVVIVLVKTGFTMMTSGSPDELSKAKKSLTKILIGYFFMLAGWLVVKYILKQFGVTDSYQMLAS